MEIKIREADANDAEMLHFLHQESFVKFWDKKTFSSMFEILGTQAWIAESRQPLGFIFTRQLHEQMEILTFAVVPEFRRLGVGRELLRHAKQAGQTQGAQTIFLEVAGNNVAACSLYAKEGFVTLSKRLDYYDGHTDRPMDALVMQCRLA